MNGGAAGVSTTRRGHINQHGECSLWTDEETAILTACVLANKSVSTVLADLPRRSRSAIYRKAESIGLKCMGHAVPRSPPKPRTTRGHYLTDSWEKRVRETYAQFKARKQREREAAR